MLKNFLPEKYYRMAKAEKIKIGLICCNTCNTCKAKCDDRLCLIPTNKKFAVRILRSKLWKSKLYYEYKFWQPDISIPIEHLPERLFEI